MRINNTTSMNYLCKNLVGELFGNDLFNELDTCVEVLITFTMG